jgi:uncharacterized protein
MNNNRHENRITFDSRHAPSRDHDHARPSWHGLRQTGAALIVATLLFGNLSLSAQAQAGEATAGNPSGATASNIKTLNVRFKNGSISMAGSLYLPAGFVEGTKYAAIVAVHPGGGVKEQTAGLYAQKLAGQGFVTLAFDASHQGASGGEPRFLENPAERVEDIRSAVDYLSTLAYVDSNRIGALGICAGSGYTLNAAQTEHRIKAVATVSAVDIGATFRKGWDGNVPVSEQIKLLKSVAAQRLDEANGAEPMYIEYVPESPNDSTPRDLREATEYYRTPRGQYPTSTNRLLFTSVDKVLAFEALNQVELLTQPLLLIAGSEAGSRWQSEGLYSKVKGPKELFIVKGATHMDLYDRLEYVNPAVEKLSPFFRNNL